VRKQALQKAYEFRDFGVTWFEEPVSSDDLEGLRLLRDRVPAPIRIAAGEYGYDPRYVRRMLDAGAVDVIQADATRCMGVTGFMQVAALAAAYEIPISAHTAPSLHVHTCSAVGGALAPLEWFHDHVRVESMVFAGMPRPVGGEIAVDVRRFGLGLELREEAERYAA
jgi:L-alanine-DL-glutamate epimerase-like enolase superfamily enzyme